ncbi:MAG: cell wall-active antibiotics response protein [Crocinitomicaceae bacterium]|nr:cell wall-active antibiotics response protein [Crocinitomicaceae bacterium]
MESLNKDRATRHQKSKILAGILIIGFGIIFLMDRTGMHVPHWILSWKTILIAAGAVTLYKHNFMHFFGYVMIGVGGIFMLNEVYPDMVDRRLILPILVIVFGTITIVKAIKPGKNNRRRRGKPGKSFAFDGEVDVESDDFISASTFFGGVTKNIVTKNFKGADFVTAFGGTEINMTKADMQEPVSVNSNTVFGGLTIIVPSNWKINSELTTAFGSVEDKRPIMNDSAQDPSKTLTLKGNCFFGGVEIHSYI